MKQVSFGKFTLLHRIARGGMAELFLARSAEMVGVDRICVIKLVSSHYAKDASFSAMFEDEVRIAANLSHPNIGQVLDVGHVSGHYYLAMELIHGKDLRAIIRRSMARTKAGIPPEVAVQIGVKICSALQYAHNARASDGTPLNIIHRDVSPSNIMVSYDGQVKLIDFGIARAAGRTALTLPGTIKGKIRYLSPEQIQGKDLDGRSDLFTLGTSLWEATVGRHLFGGKMPTQIYEAVINGQVKRPSQLVPGFPAELEEVLLRALARRREDRYADARQMQHALERFAAGAGIPLSDLSLSEYMGRMFDDELSSWREAQESGASLLQYMQTRANEVEHSHDLDDVLSLEDQQTTIPEPPDPRLTAPDLPKPTPPAEGPRKTVMMGSGPGLPQNGQDSPTSADQGPRKTKLYGTAPDTGQPPPATPDDHRPTIVENWSAQFAPATAEEDELERQRTATAPTMAPTDPDQLLPGASAPPVAVAGEVTGPAQPPEDGATVAPEPVVGRDQADLAAKLARAAEPEPGIEPERHRRKRTRTGDWAHQATAQGEGRSSTHPLFREMGQPAQRGKKTTFMLYGGRRAVWIFCAIVLISAAGGFTLWYLGRPAGPTTAATARPDAVPPAPRDAGGVALHLTSEPGGATVYNADDGEELGRTPLDLRLDADETRRVQLRLEGHRLRTVELSASHPPGTVRLEPLPGDGQTTTVHPPAPAPRHPRRRRAPRKRRSGKSKEGLKDPFGS